MYNKEVDDLIHQMVYGCNLPESSRREVNERVNSNPMNKLDPKIAAKIAARDKQARKSKNKCMYALFSDLCLVHVIWSGPKMSKLVFNVKYLLLL